MTRRVRAGIIAAALAVFAADRVTKYVIIKSVALGQSIKVIPGIFHITLVNNNGAAFGLFRDRASLFIAFSLFAISLILLLILRAHGFSRLQMVSLALILGGALGNLIDRLKFGYVIDFLDFRVWPVFNVADSAISVGVALVVLSLALKKSG